MQTLREGVHIHPRQVHPNLPFISKVAKLAHDVQRRSQKRHAALHGKAASLASVVRRVPPNARDQPGRIVQPHLDAPVPTEGFDDDAADFDLLDLHESRTGQAGVNDWFA